MNPTDAERGMDALAARAVRRATELPAGTPEGVIAAAEKMAFDMLRGAITPEQPLPDVLSLDQARKMLAEMEGGA